jgi:cell division protein FtsN
MADRRSLGIVGFVFGGITAAVMLVAVMVVKNHVDSRANLDQARPSVMAASAQAVIR